MPGATLLPDQLAADLGTAIVAGRRVPGEVIRLEDLERGHGVSRTVARDAVKSLAQLGLLTVRRRIGCVVADPAAWDDLAPLVIRWRLAGPGRLEQLQRISELRLGVEPVAAGLAAARATDAQRQTLVAAADGLAETSRVPDLAAYLGHDIVFHRTILEASGNPMFASLAHVVEEVLTGRTRHDLMPAIPAARAVTWHAQVAALVAAGNGPAAEATMRLIVTEAQTSVEEIAAP